jgi:hypothetical protein
LSVKGSERSNQCIACERDSIWPYYFIVNL